MSEIQAPSIDFLAEKLSRRSSEVQSKLDTTFFHKHRIDVSDADFFNEICQSMGVNKLTATNSGGSPIFFFAKPMPKDTWEIQIRGDSARTFRVKYGANYSFADIYGNPRDL